ncbi:MAG: hypothetical protein FJ308_09540 [Planctomycetes bacterium]|nr:hypothetical protein [Planctomycetota bacterium]
MLRYSFALHGLVSLVLLGLGVYGLSDSLRAQSPDAARLMPVGGMRGSTVTIELPGKWEKWPVSIWSSSPHVQWLATETAGKVSATIAPEAKPGVHFVRFYNESVASPLLRFIVGGFPEGLEVEPNDDVRQPQSVEIPASPTLPAITVNGSLQKSGDVDHFGIRLAKDQLLTVSIDSHRNLKSPMDASLQVLDTKGNLYAQNLDALGLDPRLQFKSPKEDLYVIRVFAFPETPDSTIGYAGGDKFLYRLHATIGDYDEAAESYSENGISIVEPSDRSNPTVVADPSAFYGAMESPRDEDVVSIETSAPGHWKIKARALELGSTMDAVLELLDSTGKSISKQGDSGEIRDPVLNNQMQAAGKYLIAIRDLHGRFGPSFRYRIELENELPLVKGSIANDIVTGTADKPIEVEVAIERTFGAADDATISVTGLPAGYTCEPVISKMKEESEKKVKFSIVPNAPCSVPFAIEIQQAGQTEKLSVIATNSTTPWLWLQVTPPK